MINRLPVVTDTTAASVGMTVHHLVPSGQKHFPHQYTITTHAVSDPKQTGSSNHVSIQRQTHHALHDNTAINIQTMLLAAYTL